MKFYIILVSISCGYEILSSGAMKAGYKTEAEAEAEVKRLENKPQEEGSSYEYDYWVKEIEIS